MTERHTGKSSLVGADRAFRAASIFLSETGHFTLAAGIFSHPLRLDHWIAKLTDELATRKVHLTRCDIPQGGDPRLIEAVTSHLVQVPTKPDHSRALVVTGISNHLPDAASSHHLGNPTPRFLSEANLDRELFPKRCPHPLLLCVTPTALGQITRFAPDLWHWCAHTFDFTELTLPDGSQRIRGLSELEQTKAGSVYANRDELLRAAGIFRTGLDAAIAAYGADHRETIEVRAKLANALTQLARFEEALALVRHNARLVEKISGLPPNEIASRIGHYAHVLQATNRLAEAEPLLRRALALSEASFGSDHPIVALRLNNLATLLNATNRLAEAEPLLRRALIIDEACFGPEHPNVFRGLTNLAQLLQDTNRMAEAEPLMRRALAISEASFGADHPSVAISLNNLAQLLQDTDRLTEAEPLMRRALAIDEVSFGPEHPTVALRLNNLARLLTATNLLDEAEPLMRRALIIFLDSLGTEHPNTEIVRGNYKSMLAQMGLTEQQVLAKLNELGLTDQLQLGKRQ